MISFQEYLALVMDPSTTNEEILSYSKVVKSDSAFSYELKPDPAKVSMTIEDIQFENALQIGNGIERARRQSRFWRELAFGLNQPVLVAEGDSWHQFPFLVDDVVIQLNRECLIWSVSAAGDTLQNMVYGPVRRGGQEYMKALRRHKKIVEGFMFSAAGNDIIGEDPETGRAVLYDLLHNFNGNTADVTGHINHALLSERLDYLKDGYRRVIDTVRAEPGFENLPIFIHGYDYPFPYPWGRNDPRTPLHAAKDEWLGEPFSKRMITDQGLRRNILIHLLDELYDALGDVAGTPAKTRVWLVNCRGAMPDVSDWIDEIHGTSAGFEKVAVRFRDALKDAKII